MRATLHECALHCIGHASVSWQGGQKERQLLAWAQVCMERADAGLILNISLHRAFGEWQGIYSPHTRKSKGGRVYTRHIQDNLRENSNSQGHKQS